MSVWGDALSDHSVSAIDVDNYRLSCAVDLPILHRDIVAVGLNGSLDFEYCLDVSSWNAIRSNDESKENV